MGTSYREDEEYSRNIIGIYLRLGPQPLIVTTRGNGSYIRVLYFPSIPLLVGGGPTQNIPTRVLIFYCLPPPKIYVYSVPAVLSVICSG